MLESNKSGVSTNRRNYIKGVGGAILTTGFAGCIGGDSGGGTTTIRYWDTFNVQSEAARKSVEDLVSRFEEEHNANVELNLSGFSEQAFGNWLTSFNEGEYPHVYTGDIIASGDFEAGGWVKPYSEWKGQLSEEVQAGVKWLQDSGLLEGAYGWMEEMPDMQTEAMTFPIGLVPHEPIQIRMDHLEAAGLDSSAFPPSSYEELVQLATSLQEDGPGDIGFQLHGQQFDWYTFIEPYASALGGEPGYFGPNYKEAIFNSDEWKSAIEGAIKLYREHEVSGPRTPSISDEETVPLLIDGSVSMSICEPMNYPEFLSQGTDLMESGDLRYAEFWRDSDGESGPTLAFGLGITNPPEDVDESEWQEKQDLAIKLADMWLEEGMQSTLLENTGFLSVRENLWNQIGNNLQYNDASNAFNTLTNMAKDSPGIITSFPGYLGATNHVGGMIQQGYKGELTAEEVAEGATTEANKKLDEFWSGI